MLRSLVFILFSTSLYSQSYFEPLQLRHTNAFKDNHYETSIFKTLEISSELPIKINTNNYLLLNPYYNNTQIALENTFDQPLTVQSLRLPIGFIRQINDSKWSLTFLTLISWNGEKLFTDNNFQFGAISFTTFSKKTNKQIRFGVYANKEFFGWFIIPILGLNWKLNDSNSVFGLLPGRFTYEHKWNSKLYSGLNFRAPLNSYRINSQQYITLYDNQLSLFLDYYISKPICLTIEPGWSVFKKIRNTTTENNYKINETNRVDGAFIKLSAAYRFKL
ncbi:hypothetical protein SAMN05192550_0765 [Flavobacterium glycines]|uniref:Uncharacterized protein n=1 Tax=Flavobacterium glycines TaxID=551990 RepID=A0A1B9DTN0_9FLAO|nr:hypothetical protein [Flavobacterium glycines]OCB73063.1 hypothetical protein FBGL_04110 [Flavobacterium glycines]SDI76947.1 hypothetical protein SAMN05192550_0765 [Flavobacterium glycines]